MAAVEKDTGPPPFTSIETPRLLVRRFSMDDLKALVAYRTDRQVARYQSWDTYSEALGAGLIADLQDLEPGVPGRGFQFAVELKETQALIGDVYLQVDPHEPRQAVIGYTLARPYQGHGLASEAVRAVLAYCFETLGLHRVVAQTLAENEASMALLERLGFRREAHFVENNWFEGRWADEYLYAMLEREWEGWKILYAKGQEMVGREGKE
jgi:RimJ/RimL family protein N-acetyltransferase